MIWKFYLTALVLFISCFRSFVISLSFIFLRAFVFLPLHGTICIYLLFLPSLLAYYVVVLVSIPDSHWLNPWTSEMITVMDPSSDTPSIYETDCGSLRTHWTWKNALGSLNSLHFALHRGAYVCLCVCQRAFTRCTSPRLFYTELKVLIVLTSETAFIQLICSLAHH